MEIQFYFLFNFEFFNLYLGKLKTILIIPNLNNLAKESLKLFWNVDF